MEQPSSLTAIKEALQKKQTSCVEVVENSLNNISKNSAVNAFAEIYADEAKERAREIDAKLADDRAGRLAGLVIAIKDNLCLNNHPAEAASAILSGSKAVYTATAIQRLLDEDAIIIGRNNCDEFGMGSSNENSKHGPVKNPVDPSRVAGGSSGGSAAAVAYGGCHIAIGSDTGGSGRQPAAFCGVLGLKPTYSRISRYGLIAYASSFDTIGILGKSVDDMALVLSCMAGYDPHDATSSRQKVQNFTRPDNTTKYKIAYVKDALMHDSLSTEVRDRTHEQLEALTNEGHQVEPLDFELLEYLLPTYYILTCAEASSNLARYDGVRYGERAKDANNLEEMYELTRSVGFGEEVKRRILTGTFVLSADYYDSYFSKAQKVRRLLRDETARAVSKYDFLITPTTPTTAFKLGEHAADPLAMYLSDLLTVQASVAGIPALSVPIGNDESGLPIGMQIMADNFQENKLLSFANYLLSLN